MQTKKFRATVFYVENPGTGELEYNYTPGGARIECPVNALGKLDWFGDDESDTYLLSGPVVRGKRLSGETVYISTSIVPLSMLMEYGQH